MRPQGRAIMKKTDTTIASSMNSPCITIGAKDTLQEASLKFRKHNIRHLPVVDGKKLVGILSNRDIPQDISTLKKVSNKKVKDSKITSQALVKDYMTTPVITVHKLALLSQVTRLVLDNKISCVVVEDKGTPIGIITTDDLILVLRNILIPEDRTKMDLIGRVTTWVYDSPVSTLMNELSATGV